MLVSVIVDDVIIDVLKAVGQSLKDIKQETNGQQATLAFQKIFWEAGWRDEACWIKCNEQAHYHSSHLGKTNWGPH